MITIAVPSYNRLALLKIMAKSLYASDLSVPHQIRIYDDCSSEYDIGTIRKVFPDAAVISRGERNLRADGNMHRMYEDFLTTTDEYFFNADSDLLFCKDWLNRALEYIKDTDGILSLFNAGSHPVQEAVNEKFCVKQHIGAAGTLFTRKRIEEIMKQFPDKTESFDWKWSRFFNENNARIFCVNNSLVQHIGYNGQNTNPFSFDYGRNFIVDSAENGQAINDIFELFLDTLIDEAAIEQYVSDPMITNGIFSNLRKRKGLGKKFVLKCFFSLLR